MEMEDPDSELEELLKDSLEPWTPPKQPSPLEYPPPEYLRTRKNIKTIAEHLQARDLLWMVSLPLVRFEPQAGLPEAVVKLNRLKELRVVQRIDELQLAERWVSTQNVNQTGNKL